MTRKLTSAQQVVLDELMKPGVRAIWLAYRGGSTREYWYMSSTGKACTKQIKALIKRGLVKVIIHDKYGSEKDAVITNEAT